MSNQIYFSGFRVEHFTGWDGVGTPTYSSVSQSSSIDSLSMIYCGTTTVGTYSLQGCLWGELSGTISDEIHIMYCVYQENGGYPSDTTPIMIHGKNTSGDRTRVFQINQSNSNGIYSITENFYMFPNSSTSSQLLSYSYGSSSDNEKYRIFYISITGIGTTTGNISISYKNEGTDGVTQLGSYSGDLSNITEIESISLHNSLNAQYSEQEYLYCVVSNFDLSNSYLDYAVASSIGYQSGWSGVTTDFSTYPVTLSQTDITNNSGVYCVTPNQSVSYTLSKTLNVDSSYTASAVLLSTPMISSENDQTAPTYTNGYSGSYDITVANYLASGTGFSVVFYNSTLSDQYSLMLSQGWLSNPGVQFILNNESSGSFDYRQFNGSWHTLNNNVLKTGWNIATIFNDNGTLYLNLNGTIVSGTKVVSNTNTIQLLTNNNGTSGNFIAGCAYTKSSSVSYPFNTDSNVTSYIDFSDANNPVIYGDTTQLSITAKSLTTVTQTSNIPDIFITDNYAPHVTPYIYKSYTNGYTGSYDISIPNYLASGTGISIVFYMNGTSSEILFNFPSNSTVDPYPKIILNMASTGIATSNYVTYQQYNNGTYTPIYNNTSILIQKSWNQITIFNNDGTLEFNINGSTFTGTLNQPMSNNDAVFYMSQSLLIGGISYINTNSVPTYPFDKSTNVTSYIDFSDPNNPTIKGDKTQFSINSSSLTSSTSISGVPGIDITSLGYSSYSQEVTSTGENHMFYLYDDPVTGSSWKNNTISSYQFGLIKIS